MNIINFKADPQVKLTLQECLDMADNLECVVVLALDKEGNQILRTSSTSGEKKAFLLSFYQAWMTKWFKIGNE